jgi:hypothetical protein
MHMVLILINNNSSVQCTVRVPVVSPLRAKGHPKQETRNPGQK